jgi:hypothetical protein
MTRFCKETDDHGEVKVPADREIGDRSRRPAMNFTKVTISLLAAIMLVGTLVTSSAAQDTEGWRHAPWRFNVNIYGWMPSAPVDITVDGHKVGSAPESFDNILDDLDMAAMFELEAHKGPIGVFVSPVYYDGKDTEHFTGLLGQRRKSSLEEKVWVIKYGLSYDFGPWPMGENSDPSTVIVQLYGGGLYLHDDIEVKIDPGLLGFGLDYDTTLSFNTPIVGVNILWDLTERWALRLGGNYGGWDVDDVNETYEGTGTISYHFKMWGKSSKVFVGYRYLRVDYEKKGADIRVDVKGPLVGLGWVF